MVTNKPTPLDRLIYLRELVHNMVNSLVDTVADHGHEEAHALVAGVAHNLTHAVDDQLFLAGALEYHPHAAMSEVTGAPELCPARRVFYSTGHPVYTETAPHVYRLNTPRPGFGVVA